MLMLGSACHVPKEPCPQCVVTRGCHCYHWAGLAVGDCLQGHLGAWGHGPLMAVAMRMLWTQRTPLATLG